MELNYIYLKNNSTVEADAAEIILQNMKVILKNGES